MLVGADSSSKQCTGIYPVPLVGGRWPPSPQHIGEAASDAQAAVGVCWYILGREGQPRWSHPRRAHDDRRSYHRQLLAVVSKCASLAGAYKEKGVSKSSPDTPVSVPSCWSITAFPTCAILPQMNRQPMCIWVVKSPFTQYISKAPVAAVCPGTGLE